MAAVLVIDFGSQVTQLIVRRVREAGIYCEVVPFHAAQKALEQDKPKAIILSGGPDTTMREGAPRAPDEVFALGVPVLEGRGFTSADRTGASPVAVTVRGAPAWSQAASGLRRSKSLWSM